MQSRHNSSFTYFSWFLLTFQHFPLERTSARTLDSWLSSLLPISSSSQYWRQWTAKLLWVRTCAAFAVCFWDRFWLKQTTGTAQLQAFEDYLPNHWLSYVTKDKELETEAVLIIINYTNWNQMGPFMESKYGLSNIPQCLQEEWVLSDTNSHTLIMTDGNKRGI